MVMLVEEPTLLLLPIPWCLGPVNRVGRSSEGVQQKHIYLNNLYGMEKGLTDKNDTEKGLINRCLDKSTTTAHYVHGP